MRTKNNKARLLLTLVMTVVVLSLPILSIDASITGKDDKLQIDLSNAVIQDGYLSLPIDKSSDELIFNLSYKVGYIEENSNVFVPLALRMLKIDDWLTEKRIDIPLDTRLITFNDVVVYSFKDQYRRGMYEVTVLLNGKEADLIIFMDGDSAEIAYVYDNENNEISLKNGDVLTPVFWGYKDGEKVKDIVLDDKSIVYDDKLVISKKPIDINNLAFIIQAQSTMADGHAISDIVIPAELTSNKLTSTASNASKWARAEIDKAIDNELASVRVLRDFQKPITREEFCELMVNLYESLSGEDAEMVWPSPFNDTENFEVLKAYNLGIVNGTGNGQFSPDKPLNREQMAKMFFTTIQLVYPNIGDDVEDISFADKDQISVWAKQAINYMFKEKIILGSDNKFNPKQEASREQAIVLVNRVFEKYKFNQ